MENAQHQRSLALRRATFASMDSRSPGGDPPLERTQENPGGPARSRDSCNHVTVTDPDSFHHTLQVAVVMERHCQPTRWEDWRHAVVEVVLDEGQFDDAAGARMRVLRDDGRVARVLHTGLSVSLHRDEAEGYWLNLSSGSPVWFVMWRSDEQDASRAWPELVSLSYHMAGRLLDAQERVDNVPLSAEVVRSLQDFTDLHYRPEPKKRRRPASFVDPDQR